MLKTIKNKLLHITIALSVLLLTSCSASFTYNNLTWLSSFWVDDYVDLNKQQNKQLKEIINTTQQWHRDTQLPAYKQDIENLKSLFNQNLNHAQLKEQVVFARAHWKNLLEHAHFSLAQLGYTLSTDQRDEFIQNIQDQINEDREQYNEQSSKERKTKRLENQLDYYSDWLGKLTDKQKQLITDANNKHTESGGLWLDYKQTRLDAAKSIMVDETLSEDEFVTKLSYVIKEREAFMSEEQLAINASNLDLYVNLLIELAPTLNKKQRESVNDEFDSLIETLNDLMEP